MSEIWELKFTPVSFWDMTTSELYAEHVATITKLAKLCYQDEYYYEAMKGRADHAQAIARTAETTGKVVQAHADTTKGGGEFIYQSTKLGFSLLGMITKVVKFIFTALSKIPAAINYLFEKIKEISVSTLRKIQGKMELYITVGDLAIFEQEIKGEIERFMKLCEVFSKGTSYKDGGNVLIRILPVVKKLGENDFAYYKDMKKISLKLQMISYEKTEVVIKNDRKITPDGKTAADIYFSEDSDYYKRLSALNKFFLSKKDEFDALQKGLYDKLNDARNNGTWSQLSAGDRKIATESIKFVGSFMSVIGKYFRYVAEDLATINKHIKEIKAAEGKGKEVAEEKATAKV